MKEEEKNEDLFKILPVKTSKTKIKHPPLSEQGILPKLNVSTILVGNTASGKTTLLHNLLTRKEFFRHCFDRIYIISPTADLDDIQKQLGIPACRVVTDLDEAPQALDILMAHQKKEIKKHGNDGAELICIIFDDIVGHTKFVNSKQFTNCAIKARHYNFSTYICSQYYKMIPKRVRLQASFLAMFACSNTECEMLHQEFSPPSVTKKNFQRLIDDALTEKYNFLVINRAVGWETRFRKGLGQIIDLDHYKTLKRIQEEKEDAEFNTTEEEEDVKKQKI